MVNPKSWTLTDNFNDNSIDITKWNNWGGVQVVETNQDLELTTTTAASYWGITSVNQYDLTNSYVFVKMVDPGNTSLTSHFCTLKLDIGSDYTEIGINGDYLVVNKYVSGIWTQTASAIYNSSVHKWIRIRESYGTVYWDYSANTQTWTNLWSEADPVILTSIYITLIVGNNSIEASGTTSKFDNFNVYPNPKTETLIDSFNDNSLDLGKWNNWGGIQVVETNQELELTTTTAASYFGINSINQYDLTSSYVLVRLIDPGNTSLASHDCELQCSDIGGNNKIHFQVYADWLVAAHTISSVYTGLAYITYDPAIHKWLRMRENSGNTYWDYSIDSLTWTNFWVEADPIILTELTVYFIVGNSSIEVSGTTSKFDDLNIIYTPLQWIRS